MSVVKVRKLPVEVESIEWVGDNHHEIGCWTGGLFRVVEGNGEYTAEVFDDLHDTWVKLRVGDRVLRGVKGEFYPIQPEAFSDTYEVVGGD